MSSKFDDEILTLEGRSLRKILRRVADFSVSNYLHFFAG